MTQSVAFKHSNENRKQKTPQPTAQTPPVSVLPSEQLREVHTQVQAQDTNSHLHKASASTPEPQQINQTPTGTLHMPSLQSTAQSPRSFRVLHSYREAMPQLQAGTASPQLQVPSCPSQPGQPILVLLREAPRASHLGLGWASASWLPRLTQSWAAASSELSECRKGLGGRQRQLLPHSIEWPEHKLFLLFFVKQE